MDIFIYRNVTFNYYLTDSGSSKTTNYYLSKFNDKEHLGTDNVKTLDDLAGKLIPHLQTVKKREVFLPQLKDAVGADPGHPKIINGTPFSDNRYKNFDSELTHSETEFQIYQMVKTALSPRQMIKLTKKIRKQRLKSVDKDLQEIAEERDKAKSFKEVA